MPLNDNKIKGLKATGKLYRVADGNGLTLEITPAGKKLWRYRYRLGGKASMLSLGEYPAVSLTEARTKRTEAAELVKQGINPAHHRHAEKANTFQAVALEFLADKAKVWTPRTLKQRTALFENYIFPQIGARPIAEIKPADILRLIQGIESEAPVQAYFARQVIGAVFALAIGTLRAETDPTQPLKSALKPHITAHHATINPSDIPAFFDRLETSGSYPTTKAAAELLWLTTTRTVELLSAKWEEFDLDAGLWTIPAERMKGRRDHVVPLIPSAVEILREIQPITRHTGLVFPSRDNPSNPASKGVLWKLWSRLSEESTPHGVRGAFSTWAHDSGFQTEVIEAQLNHADRNTTRASYNRSAYLDKRRELLTAWAGYLAGLRDKSKVIPFRRVA